MDKNTDIQHEVRRLRLLAAVLDLQHYTSTESNIVPIPGGDRVIAIGTPAQVRALLAADVDERCPHCDGTGDVHRADGTWGGTCTCPAGAAQPAVDAAAICDGVAAKSKNSLFRSGAKICAGEIRAAQAGADLVSEQDGSAITLYRPSNGTEGDGFMSRHCYQCKHDDQGVGERVCEIIGNTMIYNVDEPEYPKEWRYGADGRPTCTKFELDSAQTGGDQVDSEGAHHD